MKYLKQPPPQAEAVTREIRDTVAEILLAVEKEGDAAVRRYSRRFDGWDPPSFRVNTEQIAQAEARLHDELKRQIAFSQEQVRNFARLQRETLTDFERETLPGVVLGQRHIPVGSVGAYSPGGRYPMLAS